MCIPTSHMTSIYTSSKVKKAKSFGNMLELSYFGTVKYTSKDMKLCLVLWSGYTFFIITECIYVCTIISLFIQ